LVIGSVEVPEVEEGLDVEGAEEKKAFRRGKIIA
jgi:hypothetical protein